MSKEVNNNNELEVNNTSAEKSKTFTKKQLIASVIAAALVAIIICVGVICVVNDVNPVTYSLSVITNDKGKLIGKWQSQDSPGLSAYVFNDDGTYDSYISTFSFSGNYETKGDKLILINNRSKEEIVYKYSVTGNTLSLKLIEDKENEVDGEQALKFDKVDSLNQKSLADMLGDLKKDTETTDKAK